MAIFVVFLTYNEFFANSSNICLRLALIKLGYFPLIIAKVNMAPPNSSITSCCVYIVYDFVILSSPHVSTNDSPVSNHATQIHQCDTIKCWNYKRYVIGWNRIVYSCSWIMAPVLLWKETLISNRSAGNLFI